MLTAKMIIGPSLILMICACGNDKDTEAKDASLPKTAEKLSTTLGTLSSEPISTNSKMQVNADRVIESLETNEQVAVIIRVTIDGYIPSGITPTAQINPYLFTARLSADALQQLETDKNVAAIEISKNLPSPSTKK